MRVEVQLRSETALELQRYSSKLLLLEKAGIDTIKLVEELEALDIHLEPIYPGQTHPTLIPFFSVEIIDEKKAHLVVERLLNQGSVEGAYIRPASELP